MKTKGLKTITDFGTVYWSTTPTKRDPKGCHGLYARKVVLSKAAMHMIDLIRQEMQKEVEQ